MIVKSAAWYMHETIRILHLAFKFYHIGVISKNSTSILLNLLFQPLPSGQVGHPSPKAKARAISDNSLEFHPFTHSNYQEKLSIPFCDTRSGYHSGLGPWLSRIFEGLKGFHLLPPAPKHVTKSKNALARFLL